MSTAPSPAPQPTLVATMPSVDSGQPWIAYEWFLDRDQKDVMLVHPDGSERHAVAREIETGEYHAVVDWSPDGQTIVFVVGDFYEGTSIWTVGVDGADATQLLGPSDACSLGVNWPAFAPDGKRLLYVCADGDFGVDQANILKVLDLDAGTSSTVTTSPEPEELLNPRWSPDAMTAVVELRQWDVETDAQVSSQIATVPIAGGELDRLTDPQLWAADPDWHPTDDLIVFGTYPLEVKDMRTPSTVYTIRPDGGGLVAITDGKVDGGTRITTPRWTPDGTRLLVSIAIGAAGVGGAGAIIDVKLAYLDLDGSVTRIGNVSGVAPRLQPAP